MTRGGPRGDGQVWVCCGSPTLPQQPRGPPIGRPRERGLVGATGWRPRHSTECKSAAGSAPEEEHPFPDVSVSRCGTLATLAAGESN